MIFDEPRLVCAFSQKPRNMSLSYGDTAQSLENRKEFLAGLGIDYRDLVCSRQIHSDEVACVSEKDKGRGALYYESAISDTDALITDKKSLALAVFTADCLSVFLYDAGSPAIGLVHAGWRSTRGNIVAKAVQLMQIKFRTRPGDLCAGFGPAIRDCCYEVGKDFENFFAYGLKLRQGRFYLDLAGINKKQLLDSGVLESNIADPGICTFCQSDNFFSFRRQGDSCGRMMSVMMLKGG